MGVHNLVWEPTIPNGSPAAVPHGKTFQTLTSIAANYARCGKLGIQIHITQMDVALACDRNGGGKDPCRFCTPRGEIYGQNCQNCLQTPQLHANPDPGELTNTPWLGWTTHKTTAPGLLFDRQYHAKPAYKRGSKRCRIGDHRNKTDYRMHPPQARQHIICSAICAHSRIP